MSLQTRKWGIFIIEAERLGFANNSPDAQPPSEVVVLFKMSSRSRPALDSVLGYRV